MKSFGESSPTLAAESDAREKEFHESVKRCGIDLEALSERLEGGYSDNLALVTDFAHIAYELRGKLASYGCIADDGKGAYHVTVYLQQISAIFGHELPSVSFNVGKGDHAQIIATTAKALDVLIESGGITSPALLVTEYSDSGRSVLSLAKLFRERGIEHDVAILSVVSRRGYADREEWNAYIEPRLYLGHRDKRSLMHSGLNFWGGDGAMSGLKEKNDHPFPVHDENLNAEMVNKVRRDMTMLANAFAPLAKG